MSDKEAMKAFNVRLTKDLWVFLKQQSILQEKSVNEIVNHALKRLKDAKEKRLGKSLK